MGKYVNEQIAQLAVDNGVLLGKTTPDRESKWSWWEVFRVADGIIAVVMTDSGVSCGEKIELTELPMYCDDPNKALKTYLNADINFAT